MKKLIASFRIAKNILVLLLFINGSALAKTPLDKCVIHFNKSFYVTGEIVWYQLYLAPSLKEKTIVIIYHCVCTCTFSLERTRHVCLFQHPQEPIILSCYKQRCKAGSDNLSSFHRSHFEQVFPLPKRHFQSVLVQGTL